MSRRFLASVGVLAGVIAVVSLNTVPAAGQAPSSAKTAQTWTPPRTPWGHPDLQGIWNNGTITPLERPSELAGKTFLTDEEAAELFEESRTRSDRPPREGDTGTYNAHWFDRGKPLNRTSLIVDPADGRLPALTPEGKKRAAARAEARRGRGSADSWEDRPYQERCLLYHGVPPLPTGYNNNYNIVQTPEYVAILHEMIHEVRMIPLDGRPHVGQGIRQWMGDSRGHWEGTTLVVETTNYSSRIDTFRFPVASETLRVVERFTRVSADKIDYQFTVHDPTTYTSPWTAILPMSKATDPMFEYACHEGNYAEVGVLSGARTQEKAADAARKGSR